MKRDSPNCIPETSKAKFGMKSNQSACIAVIFIICFVINGFVAKSQVAPGELPNIVFIMADDGRYDEYRVTGGPDWFIAPNIERIANEGANFSRTYAPTPICGPSRASIYTGLYAHEHKTANNGDTLNTSLPKIQEILHDQGYYTGFIGKYGNGFLPPFEFDYWVDIGDNEIYKNFWIKVNGENVFVPGHITNSFNDYINAFFDSVSVHSDQPFALFFFPLAPHTPNTPRASDASLYYDEIPPFPENFYPYDSLCPEFYIESGSTWVKDTIATKDFIKDRFSCLIGLDENINKIFNRLDTTHVTDSTFILYTSDNGYINGEHMMRAKALPIDESIHVPLFIRYPEWFSDSTIIDDDIIELIDIPKTLLEIAGVDDTFNFSGLSIRELAEPDTMRHFAFYEYEGSEPGDLFDVPDLRGLRGFDKAYYYSNCDCFTEEFYDFTLDPQQNQNQIFNPTYQDEINFYRLKLQELRLAKNDTAPFQMNACKLVDAFEIPDGYDNDCDGMIDDSLDAFIQYADEDGDGYGNPDSPLIVFGELDGYVINNLDCDDTSPFNYPFAVDFCDGLDNDCDALVDEDNIVPLVDVEGPADFCVGGLTHLIAAPIFPGYQLQWYRNGFPIADANHAVFDATKTGNYHVKYTAPAGCITVSTTKVIMVTTPPSPIIYNVSTSNDLCKNNPVKLQVKNKIGNTYQWYKGIMLIPGATSNIYFATTPGNYKVLQSDVNGCAGMSKLFTVVNFCDEGMFAPATTDMQLFPNPNNGNFVLTCNFNNDYSGDAKLLLHNIIGDVVWESEIAVNKGEVNTEINTNNQLPNGMYMVTISVGQWQNNMQFILER